LLLLSLSCNHWLGYTLPQAPCTVYNLCLVSRPPHASMLACSSLSSLPRSLMPAPILPSLSPVATAIEASGRFRLSLNQHSLVHIGCPPRLTYN
jgi:hypothetical protein